MEMFNPNTSATFTFFVSSPPFDTCIIIMNGNKNRLFSSRSSDINNINVLNVHSKLFHTLTSFLSLIRYNTCIDNKNLKNI